MGRRLRERAPERSRWSDHLLVGRLRQEERLQRRLLLQQLVRLRIRHCLQHRQLWWRRRCSADRQQLLRRFLWVCHRLKLCFRRLCHLLFRRLRPQRCQHLRHRHPRCWYPRCLRPRPLSQERSLLKQHGYSGERQALGSVPNSMHNLAWSFSGGIGGLAAQTIFMRFTTCNEDAMFRSRRHVSM